MSSAASILNRFFNLASKLGFAAFFCFSIFCGSNSFARKVYYNELTGKVGMSNLAKSCQTCHSATGSPKSLNKFGSDFLAMFIFSNGAPFEQYKDKPRDEKWAILLAYDSDGDGVNNLQEIKSGQNPGVTGP